MSNDKPESKPEESAGKIPLERFVIFLICFCFWLGVELNHLILTLRTKNVRPTVVGLLYGKQTLTILL